MKEIPNQRMSAEWVFDNKYQCFYCSNCNYIPIYRITIKGEEVWRRDIRKEMKFCPNCGAKMITAGYSEVKDDD